MVNIYLKNKNLFEIMNINWTFYFMLKTRFKFNTNQRSESIISQLKYFYYNL